MFSNEQAMPELPCVVLKHLCSPHQQQNISYIENTAIRDTMLNMTLTALAPKFSTFQTSDYEVWFQVHLVVLLASFQPSLLVVIPTNISCDSYDAV